MMSIAFSGVEMVNGAGRQLSSFPREEFGL